MPKIEVINTETGEHILVEKIHFYRQLRKRGIYALLEDMAEETLAAQAATEEVVLNVVGEEPTVTKRGRGRPRKDA